MLDDSTSYLVVRRTSRDRKKYLERGSKKRKIGKIKERSGTIPRRKNGSNLDEKKR